MAVHDFIKNCQYQLNELDNYIYLYEFDEPLLNYITDRDETNGKGVNINGSSTRLYCESVQYSSTSSINNRFSFENTLTVTLLETKEVTNYKIIQQLLNGNWMVVFKNVGGDAFVVNAEFPVMVSYQYVFNDEKSPNTLTITFKAIQNTPTINLSSPVVFSSTIRDKGCEYNISRIKSLKMIAMNKANVDIEGDSFYVEEIGKGNLKTIEFNDTTMSFTDSYDGKEFKQTLSFQIPFNSYRFYFHYNLLEYLENRYYALIETSNGNNILGGFREGLFPSYSISTSDNNNVITIELNAIYTTYSVLGSDTMRITTNDEYNYKPITSDCVNGIYTYTLIEQINSDGTTTNSYYCLEGYEDNFSTYNIIGTYKQFDTSFGFKLVDYNFDCGGDCRINDLPITIVLSKSYETVCYDVITECNVEFITDSSNIKAEYNEEDNKLCITSLVNEGTFQIKARFDDGTSQISTIIVGGGDVTGDTTNTIYITAEAQVVEIIPSRGYGNIKSISTNLPYTTNQTNNGYNVTVKENTDDLNKRAYTIVLGYLDGTTEIVNIIQDMIYYKIIKTEESECFDEDLYYINKRYKGYTPEKIDIFVGNEKGNLIDKQSTNCISYDKRNVIAKVCVEGKTYELVHYEKSNVVIKKELQYYSDNCDNVDKYAESTEYIINTGITECVNNIPYYIEEQWAKVDGELIKLYPTITRVSTTEAIGSNACDILDPSNPEGEILYRWVDTNETYCLPE